MALDGLTGLRFKFSDCGLPATDGALNFSRAAEANGDFAGFDNDRNFSPAIGQLQHAFEAGWVFEHVDIFERDLTPGEIRTGSRSIRSKVLAKNESFFVHGSAYVFSAHVEISFASEIGTQELNCK